VRIEALLFDDRNEDECGAHGVTVRELQQVLEEAPRFFRNKGGRGRAPYVMIGPSRGGRLLTIPIDPLPSPGVWRPRTAYDSPQSDRTRYYS